ncbi:ATP synthase subunit I [Giesbergeria anulus]|uniref:ATP synthase protein I n=1 Tax=Giesbergeria anulus TaxID=180197 RepID=A0A1H9PP27_9BURK|nr:ATP synthase subunit I [Giesbergeria anulus]SER49907.1 ATP synthase protein I [Giesbergeria anulus]
MKTIAPFDTEAEAEESDFKPLSAEQAQVWRQSHKVLSVWRVIAIQVAVGVLMALLLGLVSGKTHWGWSAAYGALAVVLPAVLFARGMNRQKFAQSGGSAMAGFFVWELVKIVLTVAMLAAAPRVVAQLSWLALLAGMVVTMKTYWIALMVQSSVRKTD